MKRPTGDIRCEVGAYDRRAEYACYRAKGSADLILFAIVEGAGFFRTAGREVVVGPGQLVVIVPDNPHHYGTDPETGVWKFLWAHVHAPVGWEDLWLWPEFLPGHRMLKLEGQEWEQVLKLCKEAKNFLDIEQNFGPRLAMNALEHILLIATSVDARTRKTGCGDALVRQVMEDISTDLNKTSSVAALAQRQGISASRLMHRFRAEVGMSIRSFREERRLARAAELLREKNTSIKAIATEVGFQDPFYFSGRFRRRFGISPRTWRKKKRDTRPVG